MMREKPERLALLYANENGEDIVIGMIIKLLSRKGKDNFKGKVVN